MTDRIYVDATRPAMLNDPRLKSAGDRRRRPTTLQREVAAADQMAHRAVADPNRQAPQPHTGPRAVRLHAAGGRRPETRYIRWVIFRQRVAAARYGVPQLKSTDPWLALTKRSPVDRHDLTLITATDANWPGQVESVRSSSHGPCDNRDTGFNFDPQVIAVAEEMLLTMPRNRVDQINGERRAGLLVGPEQPRLEGPVRPLCPEVPAVLAGLVLRRAGRACCSLPPEILNPRRRQPGVAHRVLDVPAPKVGL